MIAKRIFMVLLFFAATCASRADEPPNEEDAGNLGVVAECFDLAVDQLEIFPPDYDSLHAFFTAAREAADGDAEQTRQLSRLDLEDGQVSVGPQSYTWHVRRSNIEYSSADGEIEFEKLLVVCEIVESPSGRTWEMRREYRW